MSESVQSYFLIGKEDDTVKFLLLFFSSYEGDFFFFPANRDICKLGPRSMDCLRRIRDSAFCKESNRYGRACRFGILVLWIWHLSSLESSSLIHEIYAFPSPVMTEAKIG